MKQSTFGVIHVYLESIRSVNNYRCVLQLSREIKNPGTHYKIDTKSDDMRTDHGPRSRGAKMDV